MAVDPQEGFRPHEHVVRVGVGVGGVGVLTVACFAMDQQLQYRCVVCVSCATVG